MPTNLISPQQRNSNCTFPPNRLSLYIGIVHEKLAIAISCTIVGAIVEIRPERMGREMGGASDRDGQLCTVLSMFLTDRDREWGLLSTILDWGYICIIIIGAWIVS